MTSPRIFPNIGSAERLVGVLCGEAHEGGSTGRRYLTMDEYFEWRTGQSVEETLDEQTSLNGEATARSATVPAYIEDLAELQFHNFRGLMGKRLSRKNFI